jgi:hypothetical protein
MKNLYLYIVLFIVTFTTAHAQVTISLEQQANYLDSPDGIPEDVTYIKDINNTLPKFVGTWIGIADGKIVELHINQFLHLPTSSDGIKIDKLSGRLLVKEQTTNIVLYSTLNISNNEETFLTGGYINNEAYVMNFSNKNDSYCMDGGEVFLWVNNNTLTDMILNFHRTQDIIIEGKCPNFDTYVPILPKTVRLVKQ